MRKLALLVGAFFLIGCGSAQLGDDDTAPGDAVDLRTESTVPKSPTSTPSGDGEPSSSKPASPETSRTPRADSSSNPAGREPKTEKPPARPTQQRRLYPVLDVVDGDTVKVGYQGGVSVRVIGIDTPETVHPSQPDECWGKAASNAAENLLEGKQVALVFDRSQGRTDAYDRTLAYLEIPDVGDFGHIMLKRGHGAEDTYDTAYQRQSRYRAAEGIAKSTNKAMWGECGGPDVSLRQPTPTPEPHPEPKPAPQPQTGGNCASGYYPCVPPYPPDVDCPDVDGPIRITDRDPHGLDRDGDGIACE